MSENKKAPLLAGAAKRIITYPEEFFPYSGFRGRYITGIHDDIYARAVALKAGENTFLLISVELGDITDEWVPDISRETGVPAGNIWLTATHNHEAPYANSGWGERVEDEAKTAPFCEHCLAAVNEAAKEALASMRPARVSFGKGSCGVNVSRVIKYTGTSDEVTSPYISAPNEHEFSDHTVAVMKLTDESGAVIALMVNYPIHSAILFRQSWDKQHGNKVSGDLSGAAMRHVEERIPGAVSLMTLGAAGDQIPRAVMLQPVIDKDGNFSLKDYGDEAGYSMVEVMGSELGDEILYTASALTDGVAETELFTESMLQTMGLKNKWEGGPPTRLPKDYVYTPNGTLDMQLYFFTVGGIAFMGIPSELVASVGERLKKVFRAHGFADAVIVTQCNGAWQYISDARGYERRTFEAIESHFMPSVEEHLVAAAEALASATE